MPDPLSREHPLTVPTESPSPGEPGPFDGIQFLYRRRVALTVHFVAVLSVVLLGFFALYATSPTSVQGTLALSFRGIERHEYPSGRKFTVEGFRSPDVLRKALSEIGISGGHPDLGEVTAGILVTPIIPGDVQARWAKQEKDGFRKDEYFPNEFLVNLQVKGLNSAQELRLFDALVKSYQSRVKYEQRSAGGFMASERVPSYERLAETYDFWDIPTLFTEVYQELDRQLQSVLTEALQYQEAKYHLAFRNIARELRNWQIIRLRALEALTYQGRLVKNKDLTVQRIQQRLDDLDIQIKQKAQETAEGVRLLALIDRSKTLFTGALSGDRPVPAVDVSALEKLLKNDYVAPVVSKVSKLQSEVQELEAEKGRLRRQLAFLPQARNVDVHEFPAGHQELIRVLSAELDGIVQAYNTLLDEYLTATVTSLVAVKQSPMVVRTGYPSRTLPVILIAIVLLSFCVAILLVSAEHMFRRVRALGP